MAQNVTANMENWQSKLDKMLHEKNAFTDALEKVEQKTNVRRLYVVMGLGAFVALYLMIGYGATFLCNFLGFLYPAYASVKAIESHAKEDDTKWLTYWVVYSAFSLIEFFTDIFLFWIPLYAFLKCLFLLYCMAPVSWNGSVTIYNRVIKPFVLKNQEKIDEALDKAGEMAQDVINEVFGRTKDFATEVAHDAEQAASESARQRIVDAAKLD